MWALIFKYNIGIYGTAKRVKEGATNKWVYGVILGMRWLIGFYLVLFLHHII